LGCRVLAEFDPMPSFSILVFYLGVCGCLAWAMAGWFGVGLVFGVWVVERGCGAAWQAALGVVVGDWASGGG
jgi:hypothetical protein